MRGLSDRLDEKIPISQASAIVHGDYRLDNVVVDLDRSAIVAVLDWEMATLGDPLADLASAVVWWDGMRGLDNPVAQAPGGVPGFPTSSELVVRYGDATGLDLDPMPWYVGFAFFKIASIFQGIADREADGSTVGSGFDRLAALVEPLVERGHAALETWT